ncbi:MAG: DUF2808 domain-containing protein [Symploca sp. SIO3C6]|uniref:DUF2808 domain-containing protein n=1 Tax=Symploca sp. SIO1C4 TaxID=2607765 RepID=A0A6B3NL09_9CYAN|nr:DUF2808 domain-containing protein [Symploca sp. SIO3C6]NER30291.1 DUF2808 domain-containing protein [Symploca sp. SIO1C4]
MFRRFVRFVDPSPSSHFLGTSTLLLGILLPTALTTLPTRAVELGQGQTFFESAPRLIRSANSNRGSGSAIYQFTIVVPENAGEPLQAVTISQKKNVDTIKFDISKSRAFIGDSFAGGPSVSLASIGGGNPSDSNEVTVVFDKPIEPGNTVTVSLRALENPRFGGIYQFGVTVFSPGENSLGLYLGSGRLHFEGAN